MLLTDLFAATVATHPDAMAIDAPPGEARPARVVVSYRQLAGMAVSIASALREHVRGEATVAVLVARTTPWLYAAQLGVLQAGSAHVCLDPAFPDAHLAHVLRNANVVAIVADAAGASRVARFGL
ncbi:MAG: AMP-binding protein, partial [Planctomycetota bacterium]